MSGISDTLRIGEGGYRGLHACSSPPKRKLDIFGMAIVVMLDFIETTKSLKATALMIKGIIFLMT